MLIGINGNSFVNEGYSKYWGENSYKKMKQFGYNCLDYSGLTDVLDKFDFSNKESIISFILNDKKLIDEAGLKINQAHAPYLSLSRALTENEISNLIDKIKFCIEVCKLIDCKYLVVHPFMPNGWSERRTQNLVKDTFDKNVAYLTELSDYAENYDVTLCLENMPCIGFSISTPEEILAVIDKVNRDNVKMCFDTGHVSAFSHLLKVEEEIIKCKGYIKVLHIHDNHGRADQHNFPGMGMTDWKEVVKSLKEINFNGVFSLELVYPDKFSEPVFERSCQLAYDMAYEIANGLLP
jgi:sugar phosphate isomerase/epimerase